jgi:hypothetical protein
VRGLFVPPHATLTCDANRTDRAVVSSVKRKTDVLGPPFELRPAPDPGPVTAREVEEILAEWQLRLGLERWEIEIAWTEPLNEEETLAEIEPHNPYDVAVLRLSSAWSAWDRRTMNTIVAHELCHLVVRDLWLAAESVESFAPAEAWRVFKARWDHHEEQAVDRLARMLVDRFGVA